MLLYVSVDLVPGWFVVLGLTVGGLSLIETSFRIECFWIVTVVTVLWSHASQPNTGTGQNCSCSASTGHELIYIILWNTLVTLVQLEISWFTPKIGPSCQIHCVKGRTCKWYVIKLGCVDVSKISNF